MKTITFYSYKGGTGRSLALANAARYLARLKLKVVALDFDLEAPGLHYKFSTDPGGKPLPVTAGVADYLYDFLVEGRIPKSLKDFAVDVNVPGVDQSLIQLIPAGKVPSKNYWPKLSRLNWHELFFAKGAKGVQVFLELKNRIAEEFNPDFLLIDSRTGITEMGGVATTLLADKVICLVLPTAENLEGARAVLRSLWRSRRENGTEGLELVVALSRLPQMKEAEGEREVVERIRAVMNEEAEDLADTLSIKEVHVLHSETALETREALRVGSGMSPDDSILLRDYLRLFANMVPRDLVEPQVGHLIQQAREKMWQDPETAVKEVEELAEWFDSPEALRACLRFYSVRNISGSRALRRGQRLWELTQDENDIVLWQLLTNNAEALAKPPEERAWRPSLEFLESMWRGAGKKEARFGTLLAEAYERIDNKSRAADIWLEVVRDPQANGKMVARCVTSLHSVNRTEEADQVISDCRPALARDPDFVGVWAERALKTHRKEWLAGLVQPAVLNLLQRVRPTLSLRLLLEADQTVEAATTLRSVALGVLRNTGRFGPNDFNELEELATVFRNLGRLEEFGELAKDFHQIPSHVIDQVIERTGAWKRSK